MGILKLLCVVATAGCAIAAAGQGLNVNCGMELGRVGPGAPGYKLGAYQVLCEVVRAKPDKLYMPETVAGGNTGQCLRIPGYEGMASYSLALGDFYIHEDCDVEISFDAKIGPDEQGVSWQESNYTMTFQAIPRNQSGERRVVENLSFKPGKEWRHYALKCKAVKWENFYGCGVILIPTRGQKSVNSLYLDNFVIKKIGDVTPCPDEMALVPDNINAAYEHGAPVKLLARALLKRSGEEEKTTFSLISDYNGQTVKTLELPLRKLDCPSAAGRNVYEGELVLDDVGFGSYSAACGAIRTVGGDFAVVHSPKGNYESKFKI